MSLAHVAIGQAPIAASGDAAAPAPTKPRRRTATARADIVPAPEAR